MPSQKTVLILGGAGFVGAHVRERLRDEHRVLTTSRSGAGADYAFDLARSSESSIFDEVAPDVVVNCTAGYGRALAECLEVNVCHSAALFTRLQDRPLHFVQISSLSATPENKLATPYGLTKHIGDELLGYCASKGQLSASILRFGQIFDAEGRCAKSQPGLDGWVKSLKRGEPITVYGRAPQKRSYIPVQTVARAVAFAIRNAILRTHDVVAPESYAPLELALLLAKLAGRDASAIVSVDRTAFGYSIPACSPEFDRWMSEQEPCSAFFARMFL